jgi:hypothetical protein
MRAEERTWWVLQAGARARHAATFVREGVVSLGWDLPPLGDLAEAPDVAVYQALERGGRRKPADDLRDLRMFTARLAEGDGVVVVDGPADDLLLGEVAGPYAYRAGGGEHRHVRPARWIGRVGLDEVEPLLASTATAIRQPIRRLPEQVRWHRLAAEVADGLGRPPDRVRAGRTARPAAARARAAAPSAAAPARTSRSAPATPDRLCPSCGLLRAPSLFGPGEDLCRDCA